MEASERTKLKPSTSPTILYDKTSLCRLAEVSNTRQHRTVLKASPDATLLAASLNGGLAIYLLQQNLTAVVCDAPSAVFDAAIDCKESPSAADSVIALVWNHSSSKLAVATSEGRLFIIDRRCTLVAEYGSKAWGKQGLLGLAYVDKWDAFCALSISGDLHLIEQSTTTSKKLGSIKEGHQTLRCLAHGLSGEIVVVGSVQDSLSFSGWRAISEEGIERVWHAGKLSGGWRLWQRSLPFAGWTAVFSPSGDSLAIASPSSRIQIYDAKALKAGNISYKELQTTADQVCWWSKNALASIREGECAILSTFPFTAVNLLVPAPKPYSADAGISCQGAVAERPACLFVAEHNVDEGEWRLEAFVESSPDAKLQQLLAAQQWDAAMLLAETHKLDADAVRKAAWEVQQVDARSIQKHWRGIRDRMWAANSCLERTASSADAQKLLLQAGLQETEAALSAASRTGRISAEEKLQWMQCRVKLLQHLDRLSFLTLSLKRSYDPDTFAALREEGLVAIGQSFAAAGDLGSIQALLASFPYLIAPRLLDVLTDLPEALHPTKWAPLSANVVGREGPPLCRDPDFVETPETVQLLSESQDFALMVATEPLAQLSLGWQPPSSFEVATWYEERAYQVDAVTGQLKLASLVIAEGLKLVPNAQHLAELNDKANELLAATDIDPAKSAESWNAGQTKAWSVRLKEYAALDLPARMLLLLSDSDNNTVQSDQQRLQIVLRRIPEAERGPNLAVVVASSADSKLDWCLPFLRQEAAHPVAFPSAIAVAEAALALLSTCTSVDSWSILAEIASCGIQALGSGALRGAAENSLDGWEDEPHDADPKMEHLQTQLQQATRHIQGAEKLQDLGLHVSFAEVQDGNLGKARQALRTLLAGLIRKQPPESRWTETWRQLRELQETAWPFISKQELLAELCRALLSAGEWKLARSYLTGTGSTPIPAEVGEQLVIDAARDYFYSASSTDAPEILQAQKCLEVLPGNAAVAAELKAIQGFLQLRDLGMDMPPLQFKQVNDRMDIVQAVLDSNPSAVENPQRIYDLAANLGVSQRAPELGMRLASTAFRAGRLELAFQQGLKLVHANHTPAGSLCGELAAWGLDHGSPLEECKQLLAFAMAHCPVDQMPDLLRLWCGAPWRSDQAAAEGLEAVIDSLVQKPEAPTSLPTFGDAPLAINALLQAGEKSGSMLDELLTAVGDQYLSRRKILLLGLFTSSFKALIANLAPSTQAAELAPLAERWLSKSSWDLHAEALRLEHAAPHVLASVSKASSLAVMLSDMADGRCMESFLLSAGGNPGNDDADSIVAALIQVASTAGGEGASGASRLRQALAVAEKRGFDRWPIHMSHLQGLILHSSEGLASIEHLACISLEELAIRPADAVDAILRTIYASLDSNARLAACLNVLSKFSSLLPNSQRALAAAASFASWCSETSELQSKDFVDPLVQWAVATVPPLPASRREMLLKIQESVSTDSVAELTKRLGQLSSASAEAGFEGPWPDSSTVLLLAFCKAIGRGPRAGLPERCAQALALLPEMSTAQICTAVEYAALSEPPADIPVKVLSKSLPRKLRLQILEECVDILDGRNAVRDSETARVERLRAAARQLQRVVAAGESAALSSAEQDAVEAAFTASQEPQSSESPEHAALQRLLYLRSPLSKVEAAAASLAGSATRGRSDSLTGSSLVTEAVRIGVESALHRETDEQQSGADQLNAVASSLEDSSAEQAEQLRQGVWAQLQDHALQPQHGHSSQAVIQLLASLPSSRWSGFVPSEGPDDSKGAIGLWTQSLALLQQGWPGLYFLPDEVASLESAQTLFARQLEAATEPKQLQILGKLLGDIWQNSKLSQIHKGGRLQRKSNRSSRRKQEVPIAIDSDQEKAVQSAPSERPVQPPAQPIQAPEPVAASSMDGWEEDDGQALGLGSQELAVPALDSQPGFLKEEDAGWHVDHLDLDLMTQPVVESDSHQHSKTQPEQPSGSLGKRLSGLETVENVSQVPEAEGWDEEPLDLMTHLSLGKEEDRHLPSSALSDPQEADFSGNGWHQGFSDFDEPMLSESKPAPPGVQESLEMVSEHQDEEAVGQLTHNATLPAPAAESMALESSEGASDMTSEDDEAEVSALHVCWATLLEKLLVTNSSAIALTLVDAAQGNLVTTAEATHLVQTARTAGLASSLALGLLLPDSETQDEAVRAATTCTLPPLSLQESQPLLLCLLAKGLFPVLVGSPALPRLCQALLEPQRQTGGTPSAALLQDWQAMMVPAAVSQLLLSGDLDVASGLAVREIGLHPALSTVENSLLVLPGYLKGVSRLLQGERAWDEADSPLPKTTLQLWERLPGLCSQATDMLAEHMLS